MSSSSEQALKEIIDALIEKTKEQIGVEKFENKKIEWQWIEGSDMPTYGVDKKDGGYIMYINKEVIAVEGGEIPWSTMKETRIKDLDPIMGPLGGPRDTIELILQQLFDDLKEMLEQIANVEPDIDPSEIAGEEIDIEPNDLPDSWNKPMTAKIKFSMEGSSYQAISSEGGNVIINLKITYKDSLDDQFKRIVDRWRIDYEDLNKLTHVCNEAAQEIVNTANQRLQDKSKDVDNHAIDDADVNLRSILDAIVRRMNQIVDEF